jgi:activator of HSP90 ATPase
MGLTLGALSALPALAQTGKPRTSLHQEVDFEAPPERIYTALLSAKQFAAFTNASAEIDPVAGGAFKLFGAVIEGRNIELVPNRRIVQAWRPAYWPAGEYSVVRFELVARGAGTRVVLDHSGFTEDKWEHLNQGWTSNYWEPLHKYLNA